MIEKLKPCLLCGGTAKLCYCTGSVYITCQKCGGITEAFHESLKEKVIEKWNKRSDKNQIT